MVEDVLCARQSYRHAVNGTKKADKNPYCNGDETIVGKTRKQTKYINKMCSRFYDSKCYG